MHEPGVRDLGPPQMQARQVREPFEVSQAGIRDAIAAEAEIGEVCIVERCTSPASVTRVSPSGKCSSLSSDLSRASPASPTRVRYRLSQRSFLRGARDPSPASPIAVSSSDRSVIAVRPESRRRLPSETFVRLRSTSTT